MKNLLSLSIPLYPNANLKYRNSQGNNKGGLEMENFVLAGKAKTVFKILELKAKRDAEEKLQKAMEKRNKENK